MERKSLPIGVSDFRKVIENGHYYVDKSKMIEDLLSEGSEVVLLTRPRRFGKTLNMSMLKYFFDIESAKENKKLFEGLYISQNRYMEEQGKYPVIYISFRNLEAEDWESCMMDVKEQISSLYDEFSFIRRKLNEKQLKYFDKIWMEKDEAAWKSSLKNLSRYLYEYYRKKVIVLIDEYDTPLTGALKRGYYDRAVMFFKGLYSDVLKDNVYLKKGIMTGILRVVKEGIFSGLNNLKVCTILDKDYSESFGLTEREVIEGLSYYGLENRVSEVREWYNGYMFGKNPMYNPWSIVNFLSSEELKAYWVNTGDETLINSLIEESDGDMFEELKKVFNNGVTEQIIDEYSNVGDLNNPKEVWQLMLFSGYLTVDGEGEGDIFKLRLPNYEVKTFFQKHFINYNFRGRSDFMQMIRSLESGEMEEYERYLQKLVVSYMSYHDGSRQEEKVYHNLMLGMVLYLDRDYVIYSNRESGYGRSDLRLEPKEKGRKRGYVMEFKISLDESGLERKAEEALVQIREKRYAEEFRKKGIVEVVLLGIAFSGKNVKVKYEYL